MKQSLFFFLLLTGCGIHSQIINKEIEAPNFIERNVVFFYKNTRKPFSGNIKVETAYKSEKSLLKVKFKNGFSILEEFTDLKSHKLALRIIRNNEENHSSEQYDSINLITAFKSNEMFTDTTKLQRKFVTNYYFKDKKNTKTQKLNGFIKFEKTKLFFVNGMKVKVAYYYDDDFKNIKESYEIFRTAIGNIENGENEAYKTNIVFDGKYQKWNENGIITEEGIYKEGIKTDRHP